MKKVYGIELQLSTFEDGLWYDSDLSGYNPKGFGIKIAFLIGKILRPMPKFYKIDFYTRKKKINYNPWSGGNEWFVIRVNPWLRILFGCIITAGLYFILPLWVLVIISFFLLGGFVSIAIGKYGFYFGNKTYGADVITHPHYLKWMRDDEIGQDQIHPSYFLCPSSTIRRTRWI